MRRVLGVVGAGLALIAATPATFGGWAVITVRDLPDHLTVGRPARIAFAIRQHGRELLGDRSPTLTVRREGTRSFARRRRWAAEPGAATGWYEAVVTPSDTGWVSMTIDADFHGSRTILLPILVVGQPAARDAVAPYDRGRHLFVAKGCVVCHATRNDAEVFAQHRVDVAPDLTGRRFDVAWLAQKLADPSVNRVRFGRGIDMPDLGLREREIAALVAYVNGRPSTASLSARR